MNKVFKVIWNHATQTWTAVSELGHAKGKTKSKKIVKLTALAGAVIGSLAVSQSAMAAIDLRTNDAVNISPDNVPNPTANRQAVAVGAKASALNQDSIAIGTNSTANWTNTISIGKDTVSTKDHAVAIGTNANASGIQAVTVGSYARTDANSSIALGQNATVSGTGSTAAVAVGYLANASAANTVAAGKSATATVDNAIAVGVSTAATARNAAALGGYATATAERATAVGAASKATGEASFAGGTSANASGKNSVAIGGSMTPADAAQASGENSIAVGTQSNANGENSIAQGKGANAALENSIAIGTNATASGISIGNEASTVIPDSIAIGHKSNVDGGAEGVAIGNEATNGGASFAAAVGATSGANANYSVALGYNAVANAEYSVALGAASEAGDDFVESTNATINGIEYKNFAASSSQFNNLDMGMAGAVVSVGTKGYERQIKNVAAGVVDSNSTDAINGSQLYAVADTLATKINNHHWNVGDNNGTVVNGVYHKDQVNFVNGNVTTVKVVDASSSGKSTNSLPGEKSGPNITNVSYDVNVGKGLKIEGNKIVTNIVAGNGVTFDTDTTSGKITINAQSTGGAASSVVSGNENTLNVTTNASNPSEYIVTPVTGSLSVTPKGKIDEDAQGFEDNGQKLTTIQTTRDMVNKAHWNLQIAESSNPTNKGTAKITTENKTAAPVHAGDTVNIFAGKNINLERTGTDITISAKDASVDKGEIIPATNTTNTNNNGTVMAKDGDGDKFANITNVVNAINSAFWKIGEENSGTVTAKGNVTAGSQVNFSNGVGTIAKVTADEANKTYKVQYDINAGPGIEIPTDGANKGKVTVKVDNSTVTINDAGQLVANSAWNANATGNVDGTSAAKTVKANATVNFDAGENLKVKQTGDEANQVYSFSLNQTLTNITSIQNKATGPKLTFGDNSINITGGNLDMGNNQITNLKPGTNGTDAVNLDQLNASRTIVKSSDGSVTVTPSESGLTKTYDLKVNLSNVAKSSWNVKSSAEGGAVAANHNATAKNIADSNTVEFKAGKNLTVEQINGDTGANVTFALSNNIQLDNNGSIKIGDTNITNGAVSNLTTHLESPVKVEGDVANATKTADLSANLTNTTAPDYKGKDAATVEDVLKAGWNLQANGQPVDAVTHGNNVNFASDDSVKITPTTDGNTSTINLSVNATNVVEQVTGNVSANMTTGKAVVGKDGNENTSTDAGNKVATVGDVANTINNTGWITKTTAGANVTVNPGDRVEYVDGQGTKANVTVKTENGQDVVNVTYDVKTDGTTITVKDGNVTANTGEIIKAKAEGDDAGKVTVKTGDDNKVATVKNVADAINSAGWIVNTGKAKDQNSFTTVEGTATKVGAGDNVNFQAGKNLEVKRDGQNIIYATSEDLDAKTITVTTVKVGKDGKDGVDGSIGVTGKDGAAVAINGKDGSIGLTGPKGADGKDGASVTIKPEKGTTTVAERDGGKEINRVTYTDKDKDGNDIKREIATLDDGLKFTGDDGQTVNRTLGSNLNVKGGATTSTTAKNIRVTKAADGQGLDVNLANNIELDSNGSIKIGDTTVNQDGITINNGPSVTKGGIDAGGKTITNVAPGKNGTDAVNVDQLRGSLTNIQGDIHKARKEGRAGIAGANAAAGLPQVYLPGKSMVAASAGTFKGQNALAVGYSRSSDNGKVIFKLQGNANTQGDVGGSVGVGYQW